MTTEQPDVPRRYALTRLGDRKGEGKYLLYSNDARHAYVLARYDETGDLEVEQGDGTTRKIVGTFWRTFWIKPDSGLLSYDGTPGRSRITGYDPTRILDAAYEHAATLVEIDHLLPTRNAAIQVALRRYVARKHRIGEHSFWGVYDRVTSSWPSVIAGRAIAHSSTTPDQPRADADWLNRNRA